MPFWQQQALPLLLCCCLQCVFASRSVCNQVPTSNPQLLISSLSLQCGLPQAGTSSALAPTPLLPAMCVTAIAIGFSMYDNFSFICQVNICKSYTHTNEIIIMITNIFFPCFIA